MVSGEPPRLPPGYRLEHEADVLVLRRPNGTVVAVFSPRGVDLGAVAREAWTDYRTRTEDEE